MISEHIFLVFNGNFSNYSECRILCDTVVVLPNISCGYIDSDNCVCASQLGCIGQRSNLRVDFNFEVMEFTCCYVEDKFRSTHKFFVN